MHLAKFVTRDANSQLRAADDDEYFSLTMPGAPFVASSRLDNHCVPSLVECEMSDYFNRILVGRLCFGRVVCG